MNLTIDFKNLKDSMFIEKSTGKVSNPNIIKLNETEIWRRTYGVQFIVNGEIYASQQVKYDEYVTLPENPTSDGLIFSGWSSDGENVVDLTSYPITQNTEFTAMFIEANIVVRFNNVATNFTTFNDAVTYAKSLETTSSNFARITLYETATTSTSLSLSSDYIEIDLNNQTLTSSSSVSCSGGCLSVMDESTEKAGKMTFSYYTISLTSSAQMYLHSGTIGCGEIKIESGSFTMNAGHIKFTGVQAMGVYVKATSYSSPRFYMNGGSIESSYYGVYLSGYSSSRTAVATIKNATIRDCTNEAVRVHSYASATISNSVIQNTARAFICNAGDTNSATLTVTDTEILNNNFTGTEGSGGLYIYGSAKAYFTRCVFDGNTSKNYGGAFQIREGSSTTLTDCIIRNSSAKYGGAISMWGGTITLNNTTITNNNATGSGGAIYNSSSDYTTINIRNGTRIENNYLNGANSNILVHASYTTVNVYSTFTGTIGFTHASGTGTVAKFAESTLPTNATYLSDEGYSVSTSSSGVVLS